MDGWMKKTVVLLSVGKKGYAKKTGLAAMGGLTRGAFQSMHIIRYEHSFKPL